MEIKGIVRVIEKDLNGNLPLPRALVGMKGIGYNLARAISKVFAKKVGVEENIKLGALTEEQIEILESIIKNPTAHGIPDFMINRRKDYESGKDIHLVESELIFNQKKDIERMKKIKCYKGVRHALGLKVRGQRTKYHGRKGKTVGVQRKKK